MPFGNLEEVKRAGRLEAHAFIPGESSHQSLSRCLGLPSPIYGAKKAVADKMAADMAKKLRLHNVTVGGSG
jgi:hypothetical protein